MSALQSDRFGTTVICPYCGATEGLRMVNDGGGFTAPSYTCEDCFTASDDGPCFDDLPEVSP